LAEARGTCVALALNEDVSESMLLSMWSCSKIPSFTHQSTLVGGFKPSERYEFVSWGYSSQYMESHEIPWFQTTNQHRILMIDVVNPVQQSH